MEKKFCPYCGQRVTQKIIEGRNRRFCSSCNLPLYENPIPATCVVLLDDKNRVLLVKRNIEPKTGYWCLPGGFMETRETPEQGALRELKEETGLCGKIDMLLGVMTGSGRIYNTILMIGFLVRNFSGTPMAGDDAEEFGWFDPDRLPEIAFASHSAFIRIYYAAYSVPPT
ncbi:MAG: NUDIX hydrolase [Desulfobacteraceae bacterium]|nr:NUDIX hydrolase [Desulfobacteraceae bacterium]MCF8095457.1 NUDIX hydrolase [Desulfobacteraceae bacterium]